ncbi:MAG: hypothetical protein H6Q07_2572 [Acidobacteria bacterium]|nr:hypothetical protein [Acidobacteriota bacterium]
MKAIRRILQSYLHRRFFVLLLALAAVYCLAAATGLARQHPRAAWCFLLYGFAFAAATIGVHLRQMAEGNVAAMFPNYRGLLLTTAGLILAVLLIWPVALTGQMGVPLLITLGGFLSVACLVLWVSYNLENGLVAVLGILGTWWLFIDIYRLAAPSGQVSTIGQLAPVFGSSWPAYLTLASALGLTAFARCFLSSRPSSSLFRDCYRAALETGDWVDPASFRIVENSIQRLLERKRDPQPSPDRLAGMLQFGIFSPCYSANLYYLFAGGIVISALFLYLASHQEQHPGALMMNFYVLFAFYWVTTVVAANFFSHRNRMPAIYLWSNLPSRNSFARAAVLSYLLVVGKQVLSLTAALLLLNAIFPWTAWMRLVPLCLLGVALSILNVSFSLWASRIVSTSTHIISWMLINMFSISPIVAFPGLISRPWTLVAVASPVVALLLWLALRRWEKTELDFS